jgi:triosephosphate isomerase
MTPGIRPLVAGNWKMNGTRDTLDQIKAIADAMSGGMGVDLAACIDALICPPATLLYVSTALADDSPLQIGAQDCHEQQSGAFTGDISAEMIADCLASHVLVGHSERRTLHGEGDAEVRAKAEAAARAGLVRIICIGETEAERKSGQTLDVLGRSLRVRCPMAPPRPIPSLPMSRSGRSAPD